MNYVSLRGTLPRDPEIRYTKNGKAYARFTVAVERTDGRKGTDFVPCVAWEDKAENMANFQKGSTVVVDGEIVTGSYEKGGKKVYTTDVNVKVVRG